MSFGPIDYGRLGEVFRKELRKELASGDPETASPLRLLLRELHTTYSLVSVVNKLVDAGSSYFTDILDVSPYGSVVVYVLCDYGFAYRLWVSQDTTYWMKLVDVTLTAGAVRKDVVEGVRYMYAELYNPDTAVHKILALLVGGRP